MTIDWNSFTPWGSLIGGSFIGISVGIMILLNGRIAGVSGVVGGLLRPSKGDVLWRAMFVAGLLGAPWFHQLFRHVPDIQIGAGTPMLIAAGLLVGVGTRYGSGCTSGHGVCGLSRYSPRSVVATITFMGFGFITVFITRHLLGI